MSAVVRLVRTVPTRSGSITRSCWHRSRVLMQAPSGLQNSLYQFSFPVETTT